MHRKQSLLIAEALVLAVFLGEGACDSICPNGITNITAASGSLKYPTSGNYGVNEIKCWKIEIPDIYNNIRIQFYSSDIESCKRCECDRLTVSRSYNDLDRQSVSSDCGGKNYSFLYEYLFFAHLGKRKKRILGSTAYIRFVSDDTENYRGFNLTFIAGSGEGKG
ncbi:unnamed protein product [Pocillopora meandrina]|uniref:CUB domain-containing protein n=1 Tax=Pocillopora meandrina TaxID=46732 RepID=A0AAU9WDZ4_9CNID|nr:unnamed protein product [Pocillopora meandrina]